MRGTALQVRVDEVLERSGWSTARRTVSDKFSGGMKRRVNIGAALLHKPRGALSGRADGGHRPAKPAVDPGQHPGRCNRQGMTILYTTHYMEEAQEISDRIGIMDKGQIIALGTQEELVKIGGRGRQRRPGRVDRLTRGHGRAVA